MSRPTFTVLVVLLTLACAPQARAQDEPGIDFDLPATASQQVPPGVDGPTLHTSPGLLSSGVALGLSLGSTLGAFGLGVGLCYVNPVAGMSLMALGLGVGPAVGHAYAGEWGHAALTSLGRVTLGGGGGFLFIFGLVLEALSGEGESTTRHSEAGIAMMAGGAVMGLAALGLAIYDIADAPWAVRRANLRRLKRLSVAPVVGPSSAGGTQYGVAMAMRF